MSGLGGEATGVGGELTGVAIEVDVGDGSEKTRKITL